MYTIRFLNTIRLILSFIFIATYASIRLRIAITPSPFVDRAITTLNTCFRVAIGVFLVIARFPSVYTFITAKAPLDTEISPLLMTAGILILLTIRKEELHDVYFFFTERK